MQTEPSIDLLLRQWLSEPDTELDARIAEQLRRDYPYFPLADVLALRGSTAAMTPEQREALIERIVLSVSDPEAARRLVDPEATRRFDDFYPPEAATRTTPDTDSAISQFLSTYGSADSADEVAVLEKLIFNPVPDYAQQLERSQSALPEPAATTDADSQLDRINRFILSQNSGSAEAETDIPGPDPDGKTSIAPNPKPAPAPKQPAPSLSDSLTESLAKIYIKTGRYERAYEILSQLSLAVPEKNAYFADQLRFLRKIIVAERLRKQKTLEQ